LLRHLHRRIFFLNFFCYEVIVKQKKRKESSNRYSYGMEKVVGSGVVEEVVGIGVVEEVVSCGVVEDVVGCGVVVRGGWGSASGAAIFRTCGSG
jgi:hypothetical protein